MATTLIKNYQSNVINALDTYNYTVPSASLESVSVSMTEIPPSGISILIQQNGSTKASLSSPAAAQSVLNLQVILNCASSDVISVIISSSSAIDQQLNTIKGIINIRDGLV